MKMRPGRPLSLTPTSPPMWRKLSTTASPGIRLRGIDPVGLILDSSVIIVTERRGQTVRQIQEPEFFGEFA